MLFYIELFSFYTYFRKMKKYDFIPQGVCSRCIHLELTDDDIVVNVSFDGGCHGNLQGIAALVHGMHKDEIIKRLQGIRCGNKNTSCPDQLALALQKNI